MPKMMKVVFPKVTLRQPKLDDDGQPILTGKAGDLNRRPIMVTVTAQDMIAMALADPAERGWTPELLMKRLPISATVTGANGFVLLDSAQHQMTLSAVEAYQFPWYHGDVITVRDAVRDAEEIEVEEVEEKQPGNRQQRRSLARAGRREQRDGDGQAESPTQD